MKKLIALFAALCLAFAAVTGGRFGAQRPDVAAYREQFRDPRTDPYAGSGTLPGEGTSEEAGAALSVPAETAAPSEAPGTLPETEQAAEAAAVPHLDYDALYALHKPEETVAFIDGKSVSWGEYFYFLFSQASYVENYFDTMAAYYGLVFNWDDSVEEDGAESYADVVFSAAEEALSQQYATAGFCEANGIALTEEDQAELEDRLRQDIAAYCGEDAAEEDFWRFLAGQYMTEELYWKFNREARLYERGYAQLYGENGALYDEAAALAWLEDNGYVSAGHILLMTVDPSTGEALDQAAAEAKRAQAEELLAELRAIDEPEARLARFRELKERYCEDTGKVSYPDGYTYTPGTMVQEFEAAVNALEEYGLSGVVQTSYGYHIILRLPLDADKPLSVSGEPQTGRSMAASEAYVNSLRDYLNGLQVTYAEGFQPLALTDYIVD